MLFFYLINAVNFINFYKIYYKNYIIGLAITSITILFFYILSVLYSLFRVSPSYGYANYFDIYFIPFVFIFLFITLVSILFCLMYNFNESLLFVFYSVSIMLVGINLFFSDFMLYFFLFYEMLLVPSFFILYKFAKTRRAVEASYLMFFWTQFGAIFLIFALFYLFFLTKSSLFSLCNSSSFNTFDVNFITLLLLIGFGVKLPIWPFYG